MARSRLTDYLQSYLFWAFDATWNNGVPVFNPLFGFSRITSPEISLEVESFKDGTFLYGRNVVKGGRVSPVVFERATSMFDSDFYEWIILALHGNMDFQLAGTLGKVRDQVNFLAGGGRTNPRRNIVIIQFTRINAGEIPDLGDLTGLADIFSYGPLNHATRIPGRGWLLNGCIPVRYKAASDFDATTGAVSLQELEVQPEYIEEFSLGIKP